MPGAGTDKTKRWTRSGGPVVILVEPQLAENVGTTARAMANFGLERLRLVNPREDPLSPRARALSTRAIAASILPQLSRPDCLKW